MRGFAAVVFALAAALALPSPVAATVCMQHTIMRESLHRGSGVVIARDDIDPLSGAKRPAWLVHTKDGTVEPVIETLAPGLYVYRLPDGVAEGELQEGDRPIGTLRADKVETPHLRAPRLVKVLHKEHVSSRGRFTSTETKIVVTLAAQPPEDAVALVLVDAKGKARSWGWPTDEGRDIVVFTERPCFPDIGVVTKVGERVRAFWVDRWGRSSPASKTLAVRRGPKTRSK